MNSPILPPDLGIDEALAKRLVYDQFGIGVQSCRLLGEGFDNTVFVFDEKVVFRFPRRRVAIQLIELELRLLPKIAALLPLSIPEPEYVGSPTSAYASPFYGHKMLQGRSGCGVALSPEQFQHLAADLGSFLSALHGLDPARLGLEPKDLVPMFDRVKRPQMVEWLWERWQAVNDRFALAAYEAKIQEIIDVSSAYVPRLRPPVLVHGDLYHRHLLFGEQGRLAGVIDWGDSCLSDRVVDLGVVYQFLPIDAQTAFWRAYGPLGEEEQGYARFLGLYYAVSMLWYGSDRLDQDLITSSLSAIANI